MMEWQVIETAPRDGTRLFLYLPQTPGYRAAVRQIVIGAFSLTNKKWRVEKTYPGWVQQDRITHWMPLPEPPK
jgi:hypothetical protein